MLTYFYLCKIVYNYLFGDFNINFIKHNFKGLLIHYISKNKLQSKVIFFKYVQGTSQPPPPLKNVCPPLG